MLVPTAEAKDAYYHLPLKELHLVEGKLPPPPAADWRGVARWLALRPYGVVDGAGEVYVVPAAIAADKAVPEWAVVANGEWALVPFPVHDLTLAEFRKNIAMHVEALNHALAGIAADRAGQAD